MKGFDLHWSIIPPWFCFSTGLRLSLADFELARTLCSALRYHCFDEHKAILRRRLAEYRVRCSCR